MKRLIFFLLFAVVYSGAPLPLPFYVDGNSGASTFIISNGYIGLGYDPYSAIFDIITADNFDAVDGWFHFGLDGRGVSGGGILDFRSSANNFGDHVIISGSSPFTYYGFVVDTLLRFDAQGWATILWEITNQAPTTTLITANNRQLDNVGADSFTQVFTTSDGDNTFDSNDDWAVVYDGSGRDPVLGLSFGRGSRVLQYQAAANYQYFGWLDGISFQPFETKTILAVLAVGNHAPGSVSYYDLLNMRFRLHSVLTHERNFYNYITADGSALLDHLTYQQLFYADNWNFIGAGFAGKLESDSVSRIVRLDGSIEEITPEPGVYCLFEDRVVQVNFRLSSSGVVDEVVVFAREHGMSFHASLDFNGQPEFLIDGHSVGIPMSRFDGNLVTESAPFQIPFSHIPLSALGEYHVNSLHFRDIFTVVGGHHPEMGGFFNVAVHRRASENRFPGLLNVPHGTTVRDVGFSSSVVPDIWFDLSQ